MTDAHWNFPGLGFDPLPGDPEVVRSLQDDARIFGQRMTDEAKRLTRFAHRDAWQGEAADAFAEHLDTLPRDLQRCGNAFSDLALALGNYQHAFTMAKARAADLECQAVKARQKVQAAELALQDSIAPAVQPPGAITPEPLPDAAKALHTAEDELGTILRQAHEFAEQFDASVEVQNIARAIRSFTEFAPDEPRWNIVRRWAGEVFSMTPLGAVHDMINEYAEFFSDLADLMSDVSGFLGMLSIPLVFVPPIGTAVGVAAFSLAAGTAAIKTSLYAGRTRDANGKLYVSGGELVGAIGDVGLGAAGVGAGARASQHFAKGMNHEITFGRSFADQLHPKVFRKAAGAAQEHARRLSKSGPVKLGKHLLGEVKGEWDVMGDAGTFWVRGGVGLSVVGPRLTMDKNWAGVMSASAMPSDFWEMVTNQPDFSDLQPQGSSRVRAPAGPPLPPPSPVMRD